MNKAIWMLAAAAMLAPACKKKAKTAAPEPGPSVTAAPANPSPSPPAAPVATPVAAAPARGGDHSDVKLGTTGKRQGSLPMKTIMGTLAARLPELAYCYEQALTAQPTLAGNVQLAFQIGADGKVGQSLAQGLSAPGVERCMTAIVSATPFPAPPDGKLVTAFVPVLVKPKR
jgi:hypothetical protein